MVFAKLEEFLFDLRYNRTWWNIFIMEKLNGK